jgi:hypothetical protein
MNYFNEELTKLYQKLYNFIKVQGGASTIQDARKMTDEIEKITKTLANEIK